MVVSLRYVVYRLVRLLEGVVECGGCLFVLFVLAVAPLVPGLQQIGVPVVHFDPDLHL